MKYGGEVLVKWRAGEVLPVREANNSTFAGLLFKDTGDAPVKTPVISRDRGLFIIDPTAQEPAPAKPEPIRASRSMILNLADPSPTGGDRMQQPPKKVLRPLIIADTKQKTEQPVQHVPLNVKPAATKDEPEAQKIEPPKPVKCRIPHCDMVFNTETLLLDHVYDFHLKGIFHEMKRF